VQGGRNGFAQGFIVADPFHQLRDTNEPQHRVEQDQDIGLGRSFGVFIVRIKAGGEGRTGGDVTARRAASGHDPFRIDAELDSIGPHPPHGTLGVLDTLLGCHPVPCLHPVIGPCRHHAPAGQVACLWFKLLQLAASPTAAEKEHDGGPLIAVLPTGRVVDDHFQVSLLGFLVHKGLGFLLLVSLGSGQAQQQTAKKQGRSPDCYPHGPPSLNRYINNPALSLGMTSSDVEDALDHGIPVFRPTLTMTTLASGCPASTRR
jgi:hypothetical protein